MASGPSNIQEGVAMGGKSFLMVRTFCISIIHFYYSMKCSIEFDSIEYSKIYSMKPGCEASLTVWSCDTN